MSFKKPQQPERTEIGVTSDGIDYDALAALLSDAVLDREEHVTAEG